MTIHDSSLEAGAPRVSTRIHGALITRTAHVRATRRVRPAHRVSGTGSSNPFPSSGESRANSGATGWRDLEAVHSSAERRVKRRHLDRHIAPHTGTMHVV